MVFVNYYFDKFIDIFLIYKKLTVTKNYFLFTFAVLLSITLVLLFSFSFTQQYLSIAQKFHLEKHLQHLLN